MNFLKPASLLAFAALAVSPAAHAQLISRTFDVVGTSNSVTTRFTVWINATNDTVVVDIDNNRPLPAGNKVGTVISFGFNTPFGSVDSAGDVDMKAKWTVRNAGHTDVPTTWSSDDFWDEHTPYTLNPPGFDQDYGVSTPGGGTSGNPARGVEYREKATFVFEFDYDIKASDFAGFFDNNSTTTNKYDFTVRWQQVSNANTYFWCNDGDSDKGGIDLGLPSEGELPPVPEPSTYGMIGAAALLGLVAQRRYAAKKATARA